MTAGTLIWILAGCERDELPSGQVRFSCSIEYTRLFLMRARDLDDFAEEYNEIRPHESLQMKTPNRVHSKSLKQYSEKKIPFEYPLHYRVSKVTKNGAARWGAYNWLFISNAARGRYIGADEIVNGIWNVYYRDVLLGYFDEKLIGGKETYLHVNKIIV